MNDLRAVVRIQVFLFNSNSHTVSSYHVFAQSAGAVEYTDCTAADHPTTSALNMTLNNLIVSFQ